MLDARRPIVIATRGSALALAQANAVAAQCRAAFPQLVFELKIIKTTGDKLQTAALAKPGQGLPKGLFTKELEVALIKGRADLAVHSLKDLPTELPAGLKLGAVGKRADARDVLIYRDGQFFAELATRPTDEWVPGQAELRGFSPQIRLADLPAGAVVATSSTRRQAQLLAQRPDLRMIEMRGNVPTRLEKLATRAQMDATLLAWAGISRLNFRITPEGRLVGDAVPDGLLAVVLETDEMLPCVGQAAVGIEIREDDGRIEAICARLNHYNTQQAVTAERAFLRAMGGGCQSPVAAYAEVQGDRLRLRAVSFLGTARRGEATRPLPEAVALGEALAAELKA
ncbi:MAG: hydroxymethylbilane synthase [Verrucomicrobia bacterium]|jgi:porphobilinogen deaminase|nr:hydroxymethylbilane synthase [Verrucomicrobiota bacterium]